MWYDGLTNIRLINVLYQAKIALSSKGRLFKTVAYITIPSVSWFYLENCDSNKTKKKFNLNWLNATNLSTFYYFTFITSKITCSWLLGDSKYKPRATVMMTLRPLDDTMMFMQNFYLWSTCVYVVNHTSVTAPFASLTLVWTSEVTFEIQFCF